MDALVRKAPPLRGVLSLPPDKAICQRAVLIAAAARGLTTIRSWPAADDCQRAAALIQALGVSVRTDGDGLAIEGRAGALTPPQAPLSCGESGTTLRLAAGLLAGCPFPSELTAEGSLARRPMARIARPLRAMGAQCEGRTDPAQPDELFPPLRVQGHRPLRGLRHVLPTASAQVKSAILLAGLHADARTTVVEPVSTRDHTERLLRHFGVPVDAQGTTVSLDPRSLQSPGTLIVPGDPSSAMFFVVAAACVPGSRLTLREIGLNPTRTLLLRHLRRMGLAVTEQVTSDAWEPRGDLTINAGPLRGITLRAEDTPGIIDEVPILMVAAACAQGATRLEGLGELRVKETDRVASMVEGLRRLGVSVRLEAGETVEIVGGPLRGAVVDAAGDHRTAMSLAVAGLVADGETRIRGGECVGKSFPEFFERLQVLAGEAVKTVDKVSGLG